MAIKDLAIFYIYILYGLIFILAVFSFSLGQRSRLIFKTRFFEYMSFGIFFLAFLMLQLLTEVFNRDKLCCCMCFKNISIFVFLGFVVFLGAYNIFLYNKLRANENLDSSKQWIKDTMDTLPVGVAFSDWQGRPFLVNYKIDELSRLVFGRNVVNSLDFFDEDLVKDFASGVSLVRRNSKDNIIISGQGIWQIENIYHGSFIETLASDVTEEYRLVAEIREKNEKIRALNKSLKVYRQNLDAFIREKELLAAKRKIHDDLGRSLILFRMYMEDKGKTSADRKKLISLWKQNIALLKGGTRKEDKGSSWDKLVRAAASAGLDLEITGELPVEDRVLRLLTEVLHEAINNAIRHGQAKTLFLDVSQDAGKYVFTIRNDGLRPSGPIVEKGGLKNIRKLVEMEAGSVKIIEGWDFVMKISLDKGASYET